MPANGTHKSVSSSEFGDSSILCYNLDFISIRMKTFFACFQKVFVEIHHKLSTLNKIMLGAMDMVTLDCAVVHDLA